jgi:hypothetical protein
MLKTVSHRQAAIALTIAFALCMAASMKTLRYPFSYLTIAKQSDFRVYYVASSLIHQHLDANLYDEAGTGVDPQQRFASDDSVIAKVARSEGIPRTKLYVYPPFLADALLPFTWLSLTAATWAWRSLNIFALVLAAGLLSRLLGFKLVSVPSLLVVAGLFCFSPVWQGMHYGQITMVLFALWSVGILLYAEGWKRTSALVLSVGALIKMTPLLIVVPILIWRDWRWMRWFAGGFAAGFVLMCLRNSPGTVLFLFRHVIPPMSGGIVDRQNKTVLSAVEMLWCKGLDYRGIVIPPHIIMGGKLLSVGIVGVAALLTYRMGKNLQVSGRVLVLGSFALLSLCISPVAWVDALMIGYILLALLWKRMLDGGRSLAELALLFAATVAMGTSVVFGEDYWNIRNFAVQFTPLILAILLVLYVLTSRSLRADRPSEAS